MSTGCSYYQMLKEKGEWKPNISKEQPFPVLQILWPDENGLFPHEEKCSYTVKFKQPILANIHIDNPWPFKESPTTRCIIGKGVIKNQMPILLVCRAVNGVWQFLESKSLLETKPETFSVYLEEVYKYDSSIAPTSKIGCDEKIFRDSKEDVWKILD